MLESLNNLDIRMLLNQYFAFVFLFKLAGTSTEVHNMDASYLHLCILL